MIICLCDFDGLSRFKQKTNSKDNGQIKKDSPTLNVVWYLPIMPRHKCLFANPKDVKNLRWHADERRCDVCFVIQLIQCNGKILNMNFPSLVKNV